MILGFLAAHAKSTRHPSAVTPGRGVAAPATARNEAAAAESYPIPNGVRYQLFRALRAMDKGEAMVVERRVPDADRHVRDGRRREAWLRSLRSVEAWRATAEMIPLLVPGTAFPRVIGTIVLSAGWCAPSAEPHWVPNLRFFLLTDAGRASFREASDWWNRLTPLERLRAMLME